MPEERLNHPDVDTFFDQQRRGRVTKPVRGQVGFDDKAFRECPQALAEGGRAEPTSHRVEKQRRHHRAVFGAQLAVALKLFLQLPVWHKDDPLLAAFAAHEDLAAVR